MQNKVSSVLRFFLNFFTRSETAINLTWGERYNFFYFLGALPIVLLFVLLFTGLFLFLYYNMSVNSSYESIRYLTEKAILGRFIRNLHRYAADAMMFFVILHLLRIFLEEKFRTHRRLAWITGIIMLIMILVQGLTGYILPLDSNSRFVMEKTSEMLVQLGVFGDTLPRSFSSPALLGKWIMWVILIMHLIIPLFFILLLFLHVLKVSRAKIFPSRNLIIIFLALLVTYTLLFPLGMTEKAQAEKMPELLQPDWFLLFMAPFLKDKAVYAWGGLLGTLILLFVIPWIFPRKEKRLAVVDSDKCTGCSLCARDCPYEAMSMQPRAPIGSSLEHESPYKNRVFIDSSFCSGCGICLGSCTYDALTLTSDKSNVLTLPSKEAMKDRWVVVTCEKLKEAQNTPHPPNIIRCSLSCSGALGSSSIKSIEDAGARGLIIGACPEGDCHFREGNIWLRDRLQLKRRPGVRKISENFPVHLYRFAATQKKLFAEKIETLMNQEPGSIFRRTSEYLKSGLKNSQIMNPAQWTKNISLSALTLATLFWVFYLGSSGRVGILHAEQTHAMLRVDFFIQTEKQTCAIENIPADAYQKGIDRMTGLVKLDNLTPEARERILKQAREGVEGKYCSRSRRDLTLIIVIDGKETHRQTFHPSGLQNDGMTYVLVKELILPAAHKIRIEALESDPTGHGRKMAFEDTMEFPAAEVRMIDFDLNKSAFFWRRAPVEDLTGKETNP